MEKLKPGYYWIDVPPEGAIIAYYSEGWWLRLGAPNRMIGGFRVLSDRLVLPTTPETDNQFRARILLEAVRLRDLPREREEEINLASGMALDAIGRKIGLIRKETAR